MHTLTGVPVGASFTQASPLRSDTCLPKDSPLRGVIALRQAQGPVPSRGLF